MTIASEITKLNTNLGAAYTAVDSKGGTLPQAQNFDNLATAISSIPSGGDSSSASIFDGNYFVDSNGSITNSIAFQDQTGGSAHNYILKPFAKSFTNSSTVHNWIDETLNEVNDTIIGIKQILKIGKVVSNQVGPAYVLELKPDTTTQYISFRALEEAIFTSSTQFQHLTSLKKVDLHNAKKIALTASFAGLSSFEEIDLSSTE